MKIATAEHIYLADKLTIEKQQITSTDLMERAANALFNWISSRIQNNGAPIHIFCGIGNNGGDGLALARLMIKKGYSVKVYVVTYSDKRSKDFFAQFAAIKTDAGLARVFR